MLRLSWRRHPGVRSGAAGSLWWLPWYAVTLPSDAAQQAAIAALRRGGDRSEAAEPCGEAIAAALAAGAQLVRAIGMCPRKYPRGTRGISDQAAVPGGDGRACEGEWAGAAQAGVARGRHPPASVMPADMARMCPLQRDHG